MQKEGKRDFDAAAAGWDADPRRLQLANDVVATICRELPVDNNMVALDYGCGSGLVTLGLHPLVGRITGADSSQGMLDVLQRKLDQGGIANVTTKWLDLEEQHLEEGYDLIVSSMTLHHVPDVAELVGRLVQALNPGGWFALADLESEDGSFHDDPTGVQHHGLARDFLPAVYERNSLTDIRVTLASTVRKPDGAGGDRLYPVLLWTARKAG